MYPGEPERMNKTDREIVDKKSRKYLEIHTYTHPQQEKSIVLDIETKIGLKYFFLGRQMKQN